ncbi:MAG: D-alanyl-D-alanine carboxypeptidase/D-alanyl-D-alanine-endopeptidase, partial [Planctomycetes bacterium]|nr:D-alanyl-D-alanine carboxypeptidase/D-alanyl-D-alanine-endopeptidase [Planctomycetota bacterium]
NGVSCLSGYITMPDGRRRCFSIMINDIDVPIGRAKDLQDRIVLAIVEDMAGDDETEGPRVRGATSAP